MEESRPQKPSIKALRKRPDVEITLIDRNPYHTLMTELHEVAGALVHPARKTYLYVDEPGK